MMCLKDLDQYWHIDEPTDLSPKKPSEITVSDGLRLGVKVSIVLTRLLFFFLFLGLILW